MGRFPLFVLVAALGMASYPAAAQRPQSQTPLPNADPYANNPEAGKLHFPLAACRQRLRGDYKGAPRRRESGNDRPENLEVRTGVRRAAK
jgi:hypothetical protein